MYVGTFHGSCRYAAEALLQDGGRQYILSAAHGLLDPYGITVGDPGASARNQDRMVRNAGHLRSPVVHTAGRNPSHICPSSSLNAVIRV
ncbi:hypothetical protein [Streptomyces sp. JV178]|uniref:hypothetical protein n=1 Tax=Streptomyces sp. JV178 TaxID=858632 RepID=UPI0034D6585D